MIQYGIHHAHDCKVGRSPSTKRTSRVRAFPLEGAVVVGDLPFRRIVFESGEGVLREDEDRPADDEHVFLGRLSTGRSDCQSMPCCFLS